MEPFLEIFLKCKCIFSKFEAMAMPIEECQRIEPVLQRWMESLAPDTINHNSFEVISNIDSLKLNGLNQVKQSVPIHCSGILCFTCRNISLLCLTCQNFAFFLLYLIKYWHAFLYSQNFK